MANTAVPSSSTLDLASSSKSPFLHADDCATIPRHAPALPRACSREIVGVLRRSNPISIPVTNTSVNPARSTAVALFVGDWAISQLWLFWVEPMVGGIIAGFLYRSLIADGEDS